LLRELAGITAPTAAARAIVWREQNCFSSQAGRMNYQRLHRRGWPIGMAHRHGPLKSACRQGQSYFKRPGQFWTPQGSATSGR
jgi:hypothetical protein